MGALLASIVITGSMMTVFGTTDTILTGEEIEALGIEIEIEEEYYGEPPQTMENLSISLDWSELEPYAVDGKEKAVNSIFLENYKYECNGKTPPGEITITSKKNGYTYKGTLKRTGFVYNEKTGKYTGYYNGTLYRQ